VDECTGLENRSTRKGTGGSNPPASATTIFDIFLISKIGAYMDSKGAGATAPSRGREIFQQKNIRDRILPLPFYLNFEVWRVVNLRSGRKKQQKCLLF
jgi:hypothetical protein